VLINSLGNNLFSLSSIIPDHWGSSSHSRSVEKKRFGPSLTLGKCGINLIKSISGFNVQIFLEMLIKKKKKLIAARCKIPFLLQITLCTQQLSALAVSSVFLRRQWPRDLLQWKWSRKPVFVRYLWVFSPPSTRPLSHFICILL
jgi:hypothetical protein